MAAVSVFSGFCSGRNRLAQILLVNHCSTGEIKTSTLEYREGNTGRSNDFYPGIDKETASRVVFKRKIEVEASACGGMVLEPLGINESVDK